MTVHDDSARPEKSTQELLDELEAALANARQALELTTEAGAEAAPSARHAQRSRPGARRSAARVLAWAVVGYLTSAGCYALVALLELRGGR